MREVSCEELVLYKILPFNLISEDGDKIFSLGEVLTPGKLSLLRHYGVLYAGEENTMNISSGRHHERKTVFEEFDYDDLDISRYQTSINKCSLIEPQIQSRLKMYTDKLVYMTKDFGLEKALPKYFTLGEIIIREIIQNLSNVSLSSQLRFLGEYEVCHLLNVGVLAGSIAKKMEYDDEFVTEIVIAGLLHDIGKADLEDKLYNKITLSKADMNKLQEHTTIGYKMLRDMDLSDLICYSALQHHENNDGSGYPYGLSYDGIHLAAQIINICNVYDNIASNKTTNKLKNNREIMRMLLEFGTKRFSSEVLYTFVHMFSYNDTIDFDDMLL